MDAKKNLLIYVVEDNKIYNRLVCEYLKKQEYGNIKAFYSGVECIKAVKNGESPAIVIQDYYLEDSNGIDVLQGVKKYCKSAEFIFLTANENMEVAVNSIKYGAYDYIIKDNDVALKKVAFKIEKIRKIIDLQKRNAFIKRLMVSAIMVLVFIVIIMVVLFAMGILGKK